LSIAGIRRDVHCLRLSIRLLILQALTVAALVYGLGLPAQATSSRQKVVVAYVFPQNRELQAGEIAASKLTRINYAFANIEGGRIVNGFKNDDQNLAMLVALKQQNPSLTVLVSVGGWQWSNNFSDMALTKASRNIFVASVADYIERHQLDGLDVDWEYPGQAGSTDHFRPEDRRDFTLLLRELRERFNRQQHKLHRPLYLTIAAGASSSYLAHTEMDKVQRYIDTVNLMAYDYYEPGGLTGNHAPLFTDPADPKKVSVDRSVHEFEEVGVSAGKIVLGVPFYGHQWGNVSDSNHGLFQDGAELPQGYAPYSVIVATMLDKGFVRYWDSASSAPSLYSSKQKIFVSYEDTGSLALKSRYVIDQHLAGMMFWDYSGDPTGVLLDAIDSALTKDTAEESQ